VQRTRPVAQTPVSVRLEDIRFFRERCRGGCCHLVMVTDEARWLVQVRADTPSGDLTRRYVFARPVVRYSGPGLGARFVPDETEGNYEDRIDAIFAARWRWPLFVKPPYGVVRLRLRIDGEGEVFASEIVEDTVPNRAMARLVPEMFVDARFPRSLAGEPYEVTYGFRFLVGD
jgi:hypothetical protein